MVAGCEDSFLEVNATKESLVNQFPLKRGLWALVPVLVVLLLVISCEPPSQPVSVDQPLTEIQSIETLRAQFNQDAGKIRLILLLSPT